MKTYKVTLVFLLFFAFSISRAYTQSFYKQDTARSFGQPTLLNSPLLSKERLSFSMEFGVGFALSNQYNYGSYTYVAPYLSYRITPKFSIDAGAVINQGFNGLNQLSTVDYNGKINNNQTSYAFFVRGNYMVNDKLTISGSIYKSLMPLRTFVGETVQCNNNSYSLGLDYKVNNHMSIGAEVRMGNGNGLGTRFFNNSGFSAFGNSHPGMMGW